MSGAMRIEKRGLEEYLVGGPVEVNNCDATRDGETCNVHFNGQHVSTSRPDADGAEYILARWPIEPVVAPAATLRPAEEIAREMVPAPRLEGTWRSCISDAEDYAPLEPQPDSVCADSIVAAARGIIARTITRACAAAALAGQQPRDLAGRIRALVQEKAGEWADAPSYDALCSHRDAMQHLRQAYWVAKNGFDVEPRIRERIKMMREDVYGSGDPVHQAADELEAIIRDCEARQ